MAFLALDTTIKAYKSEKNDLTQALVDNAMDLKINANYYSAEQAEVTLEFESQKDVIEAQRDNIDDRTSEEYDETILEIQELNDEMDRQLAELEDEEKEYETQLGIENKQIEARLEAVKADLEALETCREENIKEDFGYFQ